MCKNSHLLVQKRPILIYLGQQCILNGSFAHLNSDQGDREGGVIEKSSYEKEETDMLTLDHKALIPVVREIDRRGWLTKRWTTRKGIKRGGRPQASLSRM